MIWRGFACGDVSLRKVIFYLLIQKKKTDGQSDISCGHCPNRADTYLCLGEVEYRKKTKIISYPTTFFMTDVRSRLCSIFPGAIEFWLHEPRRRIRWSNLATKSDEIQ